MPKRKRRKKHVLENVASTFQHEWKLYLVNTSVKHH